MERGKSEFRMDERSAFSGSHGSPPTSGTSNRQNHEPVNPSAPSTAPRPLHLLLHATRQVFTAGGQLGDAARDVGWRGGGSSRLLAGVGVRFPSASLGSYERATDGTQGGERGNGRGVHILGEHPRKPCEEPLDPDEGEEVILAR